MAERQVALVYPIQTPGRCRGLGSRNAHDLIGLDGGHVRVFPQFRDVGRLHLHREAAQSAFVDRRHPPAMILAQPGCLRLNVPAALPEGDDVAVRDGANGKGCVGNLRPWSDRFVLAHTSAKYRSCCNKNDGTTVHLTLLQSSSASAIY